MLSAYVTTLFLSAALMFAVQPMFGKMLLPLLGGAPAVWNTEVVFCQGVLLLGYLYSHASLSWLGVRRQAVVQCFLILLPLPILPIGMDASWNPPVDTNPFPWLFSVLLLRLGPPLFVISTISPMLQRWFASIGHLKSADPYFLYAASNAGSMLGLLGYPVLFEPYLTLQSQSDVWRIGYGFLILMTLVCAAMVWRATAPVDKETLPVGEHGSPFSVEEEPVGNQRRFRWLLMAFAPSSLMLSVTNYLSTNIAPVPLLWVIPLALYLCTFILVFARRPPVPHRIVVRVFPATALVLLMAIVLQATRPIWLMIPLHLVSFFVIAMVCHGKLANDRPAVSHLTEFYLWVSLGGVLGGVFNVLLAPAVFSSLIEYPLILLLVALIPVWPEAGNQLDWKQSDLIWPAVLAIVGGGLIIGSQALQLDLGAPLTAILIALTYTFSGRPLRFGLGLAAVLMASSFYTGGQGQVLYAERNFFGVHRVLNSQDDYHVLVHSGTLHGKQSLQASRRCQPLSYYHPKGPLGQLFAALGERSSHYQVAAVGLGAGSMAGYSRPGQQWTFYEIDPTVVKIASDPRYFTYLTECGTNLRIVLGDARISLAKEPSRGFDLLILDAYSSDSIPLHLVTREALDLYLDKITERGILIFHVSNQYLDLKPVLGNLAKDAGLTSLVQEDLSISDQQRKLGQEPSQWVVMGHSLEDLQAVAGDRRWKRLEGTQREGVWTDTYSSILSVLRWRSPPAQ